MKRLTFSLTLIMMLIALAACNFFAPEAGQQTLSAERFLTATALVPVRDAATVQADRLLATVQAAQTAIRQADAQSTRISATLIALGTPFIDPRMITPLPPDANANGGSVAVQPVVTNASGVQVIVGQGSAQGNAPLVAPTPTPPEIMVNPVAQPTADPNQPTLANIAMSSAVGADDCPTAVTNAFAMDAAEVYVTATALNIAQGSSLVARWSRDGAQLVEHTWTPSFDIQQGCIWFLMTTSDVGGPLTGNWTVSLELNGTPIGQPTAFTVS